MGIHASYSILMISVLNKSDKIDLLIKSRHLDQWDVHIWTVWGWIQRSHAHEALIELEKVIEIYIELEVDWNASSGLDPNRCNKGAKSHNGQ
jgi:hypothetical protein